MHLSLERALQHTLKDILTYGHNTSPRGRASKEILGYKFTITNPRNRIVGFKDRDLNPFYLVGNLLWVLRQSNKLDIIKYYNPRGSMFSDDGETLRGAYGKRIFDFDGVNQWHQCIKELKVDPDSRRAIISIHLPQHDWSGSLDTPCTSDFQFFIRENQLHMINHMRSQSAAFVMPYDVFLMTMIQELMANELGVGLGEYQHFCNSMHYFANEDDMVDAIILSEDYSPAMQHMQGGMAEVKKLLRFEEMARLDAIKMDEQGLSADEVWLTAELKKLNLPLYWEFIGEVLIARALWFPNPGKHYEWYIKTLKHNPFQKLLLQQVK